MNVSKNSVVGKVHRLCLKARPSPIKKKDGEDDDVSTAPEIEDTSKQELTEQTDKKSPDSKKTKSIKQTKTEDQIKELPEADFVNAVSIEEPKKTSCTNKRNIKLVDLDSHTCRWPIGDPREENFCFCGKKVRAGQTYCDEHSQIAYIKALAKK